MTLFYPSELEAWWLRYAEHAGVSQERLEAEVKALSDAFTTERASRRFGTYFESPAATAAYGLFYFPQTYMRMRFVLRELAQRGWAAPDSVSILDLGAGTGAASFAAVDELGTEGRTFNLSAVESSQHAFEILGRLAADVYPALAKPTLCGAAIRKMAGKTISDEKDRYDLIVSSFALNEAFSDAAEDSFRAFVSDALRWLSPGGALVILEPVLAEASSRLERLRNELTAKPVRIWAPCPHRLACPILENGVAYCHDVRHWQPPASLLRLNRKLYRSVEDLKFSFLALGNQLPTEVSGDDRHFRQIAPLIKKKGRLMTAGCAADGAKHTYEIQTRIPGAKRLKAERGDRWTVGDVQVLGNGDRRILGGIRIETPNED